MDRERQLVLLRYRKLKEDIERQLDACATWNESVRQPDEPRQVIDPFGELRRLADAIGALLDNDPGHGPIQELNWERSH